MNCRIQISKALLSKLNSGLLFALLILLIVCGNANSVAAQCKKKTANKLIADGNAAYGRNDYQNALAFYRKAAEADAKCAAAYFNVGSAQRRLKQNDAAMNSINRAINLNLDRTNLTRAYCFLGLIYLDKGDSGFAEALKHGEKALSINPNSAEAWTIVSLAQLNLKRNAEALKAVTEVIRITPEDKEARFRKGILHYQLKQYREALTEFYELTQRDPQNALNFVMLGETYTLLGNFTQGLEALQKAVQLKPDFGDAYINLGHAYLYFNQYAEAAEAYRNAIVNKSNFKAEPLYGEGIARLSLGQYKEAIDLFNKALQHKPTLTDANSYRAFIFSGLSHAYGQLADYRKAVEYLRQAKELNFNDEDADTNLSWWYSLMGEQEAAVEAGRRAIEKSPRKSGGYTNRCRAHYQLRLFKDAAADCRKSLEINPTNNGEAMFYLGRIMRDQKQTKEADIMNRKAIAALEKELNVMQNGSNARNPNSSQILFGNLSKKVKVEGDNELPMMVFNVKIETPYLPYALGSAYFDDKQLNKAVTAYTEAIRRSPKFATARFNLGLTYFYLKKKQLALEQYNELAKFDQRLAQDLKKIIDGK